MQIEAILWFKVNLENMLEMFTKACCHQKYKKYANKSNFMVQGQP